MPATAARLARLRTVPPFALVMAALLAIAAFPQSALFAVQRIDVIGAAAISPEAVVALTGLARGERLFAVRVSEVVQRLRAHPRIRTAEVRVRPPDALVITITERRPVVALSLPGRFALIDENLMVVAVVDASSGLPEVVDRMGGGTPRIRLGAPAPSAGVRIALAAMSAVPPGMRDDIAQIRVLAGPDLTLVTRGGLEIRAGGLAGLHERLLQVPGVLSALEARRVAPAALDLRYAGSIVVTPALESIVEGDGR